MLKRLLVLGLGLLFSGVSLSEPFYPTQLTLNGKTTTVYFNDGDTFHYQDGKNRVSARLSGYNALESYGPVHQWGHWKGEELYANAKEATQEAQKGGWHCDLVGAKDKYGRVLAHCPDLAEHLISKGLAHVMLVDSKEESQHLVDIQRQAIRSRVGMWDKGIPDFILTSVHSTQESGQNDQAYDRFVSTETGRSLVRKHSNAYSTCELINYTPEERETASSMLYIPFTERYGKHQAACLQ